MMKNSDNDSCCARIGLSTVHFPTEAMHRNKIAIGVRIESENERRNRSQEPAVATRPRPRSRQASFASCPGEAWE